MLVEWKAMVTAGVDGLPLHSFHWAFLSLPLKTPLLIPSGEKELNGCQTYENTVEADFAHFSLWPW